MVAVAAIDLARSERSDLCDLLTETGPDAPTLCEGWTTRDLAAHLVIRESRPDAALGVLGGPLASWTEKVQNDAASQDYGKLVTLVRNGPPAWSYFRLPWVDGQFNTVEYYVHHEDVRRAQPQWTTRDLSPELQDFLWDRLTNAFAGRGLFHSVDGGVTLVRTDRPGVSHRAKSGDPEVTISGTPGELIMIAFGRREADVEIEGTEEAVAAFAQARLHIDTEDLWPDD